MCLYITAKPANPQDLPDLVARWPSDRLAFDLEIDRSRPVGLVLHGCELLTDEATWEAETWDMAPDVAEQLAESLVWVFDNVAGDIAIEALWDPDRADTSKVVSRAEFIELAKASRLGTKTHYTVRD